MLSCIVLYCIVLSCLVLWSLCFFVVALIHKRRVPVCEFLDAFLPSVEEKRLLEREGATVLTDQCRVYELKS